MPINFDQLGPVLPLSIASLLLLVTAIDAKRDQYRPLWLSLLLRIGVFAALTWLLQRALGSALVPQFHTTLPGGQFWGRSSKLDGGCWARALR
jgi:hypothetical protein